MFWLGTLSIPISQVIIHLFEERPTEWIPYAWLLGIGLIGISFLRSFLWMLLGREIISVKRGVLKIRKQVLDIGFTRTYTITKIKELKINPAATPELWRKLNHPRRISLMEFEYESSTIKFGAEFDLAEANLILEEFKRNKSFNPSNFAVDSGKWIEEEDEYVSVDNFLKKLNIK
ncbi:MAG: hypothetical protein HOP30_13030 [Cyclobacteriaceae bacterium]|nr:hypothetical protein [Cyclobacteriaceae bacterium]